MPVVHQALHGPYVAGANRADERSGAKEFPTPRRPAIPYPQRYPAAALKTQAIQSQLRFLHVVKGTPNVTAFRNHLSAGFVLAAIFRSAPFIVLVWRMDGPAGKPFAIARLRLKIAFERLGALLGLSLLCYWGVPFGPIILALITTLTEKTTPPLILCRFVGRCCLEA